MRKWNEIHAEATKLANEATRANVKRLAQDAAVLAFNSRDYDDARDKAEVLEQAELNLRLAKEAQ